jgi:trimeric autotransporter adhesin
MTYFTRELANDQNDTVHYQNLNDTYEYEAPKKFLTEEENTPTIQTTNINSNQQFNQSKPAFLNSYKFMTNNTSSNSNAISSKDAIVNSNINSTNTSILYSPKVFQHEGTNSRYSSASSLEQDDDDDQEEKTNSHFNNNYVSNTKEEEEDEDEENANLTNSNLNTTTKPMNTPAGLASMSGTSLIDDDNESKDEEEDDADEKSSSSSSSNKLANKSSNKLELGILDLENFISELYAQSTNGSPAKLDEEEEFKSRDGELEVNKKKILKRSSLQNIININSSSSFSSTSSVSSLTMASDSTSSLKSSSSLLQQQQQAHLKSQSQKRLSICNDRTGAVINIVSSLTASSAKNGANKVLDSTQQNPSKLPIGSAASSLVKSMNSSNIPTTSTNLRCQAVNKLAKKPSETSSIETNGNRVIERPPISKLKSNLASSNVGPSLTNQQAKTVSIFEVLCIFSPSNIT